MSQSSTVPPTSAERDEYLPNRLADLVNVVFAVVIAESLARFNGEIVALSPLLILFALFAVYVTTISSWWGYHRSLTDYPYLNNHFGFARFLIDLSTVVVYVYLIYSVRNISDTGNLVRFISGVPVVFLAYLLSGVMRRIEYKTTEASHLGILIFFALAASSLAIAYNALYDADQVRGDTWNWIFVGAVVALVLAFRLWRLIYYAPLLKNWR